jgi:hypothetical protein
MSLIRKAIRLSFMPPDLSLLWSVVFDTGTSALGRPLFSSISRQTPHFSNTSCASRTKTCRQTMSLACTGPQWVRCLRSLSKHSPPTLRPKSGTIQQGDLSTWEIEYLDVLRDIPETVRKEPPASNYRPSNWKPYPKTHNTRSRARCQPGLSTPKRSSSEGSSSDEESPSPSTTAAVRSRSSRGQGEKHQPTGGREGTQSGRDSGRHRQTTRPYCTMACIRGIINREPLDKGCPNLQDHLQHSID